MCVCVCVCRLEQFWSVDFLHSGNAQSVRSRLRDKNRGIKTLGNKGSLESQGAPGFVEPRRHFHSPTGLRKRPRFLVLAPLIEVQLQFDLHA